MKLSKGKNKLGHSDNQPRKRNHQSGGKLI